MCACVGVEGRRRRSRRATGGNGGGEELDPVVPSKNTPDSIDPFNPA